MNTTTHSTSTEEPPRRVLAVGDLHGCLLALKHVLVAAEHDAARDQLVLLGDYVDRGPASREILEWILAYPHPERLVTLKGNHEFLMAAARVSVWDRELWEAVGGTETLASYGIEPRMGHLSRIPVEHWLLLGRLLPYFANERHIYVHAGVEADKPLERQSPDALYWNKLRLDGVPHASGRRVICGHTAQKTGLPLDLGHTVCIDTCAYGSEGWLTCLDANANRYWQANQHGATRTGTTGPWPNMNTGPWPNENTEPWPNMNTGP